MAKSFYALNDIFINKLSSLSESKRGKDIIKKYTKIIKEDKILKQQYLLHTQFDEGVSKTIKESKELSTEYLNEILKSFNGISKNDIKNSNMKLYNFMVENKLVGKDENIVSESKIHNIIENIIFNDISANDIVLNKCELLAELKVKTDDVVNENVSVEDMILSFNEKYKGKLTKEEMEVVKALVYNVPEEQTKSIIKEYHKTVLNTINDLLKEATDTDLKEKFLQIKELILFENAETIDSTIKLFEIRNIISEIEI
jgi:hypothetical protein